jgi:cyclase
LSTPLTYGGGIQTAKQAADVIQSGAERICIDTAFHGDSKRIREMASLIGAQAVVAGLPLSVEKQKLSWYDYRSNKSTPFQQQHAALFSEGVISEALVIDWKHEGHKNSFDQNLISQFPYKDVPLIVFGGLSEPEQLAAVLEYSQVVAAGVGNFLSYSEHAVQTLKQNLLSTSVRSATYAGQNS